MQAAHLLNVGELLDLGNACLTVQTHIHCHLHPFSIASL